MINYNREFFNMPNISAEIAGVKLEGCVLNSAG